MRLKCYERLNTSNGLTNSFLYLLPHSENLTWTTIVHCAFVNVASKKDHVRKWQRGVGGCLTMSLDLISQRYISEVKRCLQHAIFCSAQLCFFLLVWLPSPKTPQIYITSCSTASSLFLLDSNKSLKDIFSSSRSVEFQYCWLFRQVILSKV